MNNQLDEITTAIETEPGPNNPYLVYIPVPEDQDLTVAELASLVARTANAYVRVARLSGMAHANLKRAKGRFDAKYKTHRTGTNDAQREKAAMEACAVEHEEYVKAEEKAIQADYLERGARVASESARKLYGQGQAIVQGEQRESSGTYQEKDYTQVKDFSPW